MTAIYGNPGEISFNPGKISDKLSKLEISDKYIKSQLSPNCVQFLVLKFYVPKFEIGTNKKNSSMEGIVQF